MSAAEREATMSSYIPKKVSVPVDRNVKKNDKVPLTKPRPTAVKKFNP